MVYHNLYEASKTPIVTTALIGAGHFGTSVIIQAHKQPRLCVAAIADKNIESVKAAFQKAEIPEESIAYCFTLEEAQAAFQAKRMIGTTNPMLLMALPIDVIVEGTGNPEAGAYHAVQAISSGKHVVMVNKETDSCVGPILRKLAEEKGLVYTPVDGDQHGALMQLVEWARDNGLEVISAGKSRDAEFIYDKKAGSMTVYSDNGITIPKTVTVTLKEEDRHYFDQLPDSEKSAYLCKRKDLLQALDPRGGFDLCEMVIAANSTGLKPDTSLLYDHILRTSEIPKVLCAKEDGGVLSQKGVIEVVTNFHEPEEAGLGGGVFLVVHCDNAYSQMILATKGCLSNTAGTMSLVYRPYHLCGLEAPTTLLCAGLLGVATGSRIYEQAYDIVQEARIDLRKGEIMGSDHDPRLLTHIVPAASMHLGGPIPAHMLNGRSLRCDVPKGTIITYEMVEEPKESMLWSLRAKQDAFSDQQR